MSEIANTINSLQAKSAGLKRELTILNTRGKNSISIIRSKLDTLNLDDEEDIASLDIESAQIEMVELSETIIKMKDKKARLTEIDKELRQIQKQLR